MLYMIYKLSKFCGAAYNLYNVIVIPACVVILYFAGDNNVWERIASSKICKILSRLCLCVYLAQSFSIMIIDLGGIWLPDHMGLQFIVLTVGLAGIMEYVLNGFVFKKLENFYKKIKSRYSSKE